MKLSNELEQRVHQSVKQWLEPCTVQQPCAHTESKILHTIPSICTITVQSKTFNIATFININNNY